LLHWPNLITVRDSGDKERNMAERLILVCDRCGRPAIETITLRVRSKNLSLDVCQVHLDEATAGAHAPKRGRRVASAVGTTPAKRRGRPPGSRNRKTAARAAG
jgi:hypothetical protein